MSDELWQARVEAYKLLIQWKREYDAQHLIFWAYPPGDPQNMLDAPIHFDVSPEEYERLKAEHIALGWIIME
jgi:hypothetical protein